MPYSPRLEALESLHILGFSDVDSEAFLLLLVSPRTPAEISHYCNINRVEAYRLLERLQEAGLASLVSTHPKRYAGVDIAEAVNILRSRLEERLHLLSQIEKNVDFNSQNCVKAVLSRSGSEHAESDDDRMRSGSFCIIKGSKAIHSKMVQMISRTFASVDICASGRASCWLEFSGLSEAIKKAAKRNPNLDVRILTYKSEQAELRKHGWSVRKTNRLPSAKFYIFDKRQGLIDLRIDENFSSHGQGELAVWIDNESIIGLLHLLFEELWGAAECSKDSPGETGGDSAGSNKNSEIGKPNPLAYSPSPATPSDSHTFANTMTTEGRE